MGNYLSIELDVIYSNLGDIERQLRSSVDSGATPSGGNGEGMLPIDEVKFRELLWQCDMTPTATTYRDYRGLVWEATRQLTAKLDTCTSLLTHGVAMSILARYSDITHQLFMLEELLPVICRQTLSCSLNSARTTINQHCTHHMQVDRSTFSFHKPDKSCTVCDYIIPG